MYAACNHCGCDFEIDSDDNEYSCPRCGSLDIRADDSDSDDDDLSIGYVIHRAEVL